MAATAGVKTGIGAVLYYNTASFGTPTWAAIGLVKDVNPSLPWEKAEAGARYTRAKVFVKTRAEISIDATVRADNADAAYVLMKDASLSPTTTMDFLCLDGKITDEGAHGYRAECLLECTGAPQEIDGAIYDTFHLIPAVTANGAPATVKMGAASTPTLTVL